ncbi:MAG TPA: VWA domain-containing protein [Bryobacteraceae bacterium]|jgi:Ca-activated chloride channel family protein
MKFFSLLLGFAALTLSGQSTIRVNVRLVPLLVTVKDAKGDLVGSLQPSDFTIYDSGVKQQISVFEPNTERPLSISVLIDDSGSTLKDLKYETTSVKKFLSALLSEGNPKDAASIISFNSEVNLLQGFTRNRTRLENSLNLIHPEGGTSLYDAVYAASDGTRDRDGRHVLVIVTDGDDTTSRVHYPEALKSALLADAVVYPIIVVPISNDAGRNVGGENALVQIARDTGGRHFYPTVGAQLDRAFADILRDLRKQYMVGYYPRDLPKDAKPFHEVRVQMSRPDLQPSARRGYYGDTAP